MSAAHAHSLDVPRILLVDDEQDVEHLFRQRYRRELRKKQLEMYFAHNGAEALAAGADWDAARAEAARTFTEAAFETAPDALRARLFTPFFTTKPAGEGTGLGLSITHDIVVSVHRGSLAVDSVPGEYAEFIVSLPRVATRPLQT